MATTVTGAFNKFLFETVNLDTDQTKKARNSRDWLLEQITTFGEDLFFPKLWPEYNIHYGSFSRRTKIKPLDDIDLMIGLNGQGGRYNEYNNNIEITINSESNLLSFCNDYTYILNSKKIINKFVSKLSGIPQYSKAEIKRNQEATTLSLLSYDWVFDIVPCFYTSPDFYGKSYYLIPDGKGNWKKSDPRIDKNRTLNLTTLYGNNLLEVIRVIKYWNKRPTMPTISSYLLETMIFNYYEYQRLDFQLESINNEIPRVLDYIKTYIYHQVDDHKGIQGNINNLSMDEMQKISKRAEDDKTKANEANYLELNGHIEKSIKKWIEIFGTKFPEYG